MPPSEVVRWTPASRVEKLLEERYALGRPLVFVAAPSSGLVHVVGPDEDQPGYGSVSDWLLTRRYRTVCGPVIRLSAMEGYLVVFEDTRLCRACLASFNQVSADAGAAIFEDNTESVQMESPAQIYRIQRDKRDEQVAVSEEVSR